MLKISALQSFILINATEQICGWETLGSTTEFIHCEIQTELYETAQPIVL